MLCISCISDDARRSKQFIVNQSTKPQQPPFYQQNFNQIQSTNRNHNQNQNQHHHHQRPVQYKTEPITTSTTTTTTTTTTPAPSTYRSTHNFNLKTQGTTLRRSFEEPKITTPAYKPFSTSNNDFFSTNNHNNDYSKGKDLTFFTKCVTFFNYINLTGPKGLKIIYRRLALAMKSQVLSKDKLESNIGLVVNKFFIGYSLVFIGL